MKVNVVKKGKEAAAESSAEPVINVPLDRIADFPEMGNRELDKEWVAELAASIEQKGLDTPLFVWNGGDEYPEVQVGKQRFPSTLLVAGLHRRAALRVLRKTNLGRFDELFPDGIPVKVFGGELKDMLLLQLRENVARQNPTAEELLPKMIRLRDEFSLRNKTIAKEIGRSEAFVTEIFSIGKELGDEGVAQVIKGGLRAKDALKAAKEVKAARKAGKTINVGKVIAKSVKHAAEREASGKDREEKRVSFKKLYEIYKSLPELDDDEKLGLAEKLMAYVAGERDSLPRMLRPDVAKKSAAKEEAAEEAAE